MTKVEDSFNRRGDNYTCKMCSKMIYIDSNGRSGEYTLEQRTFLILMTHIDKDCK